MDNAVLILPQGTRVRIKIDSDFDKGPNALRGSRINGEAIVEHVVTAGYGCDVYHARNADGTEGQYCRLEMFVHPELPPDTDENSEVTKPDPVNHPAHYNVGGVEVIDAIFAWDLNFSLGNAIKYIARAGRKDPSKTVEDLKKARWYLDFEIEAQSKKEDAK